MQNFPVPKKSQRQWTEWFKAFQADGPTVHAGAYPAALAEVDSWMRSPEGMPKDTVGDWDAFFAELSTVTPRDEQVVVQGSAWGALEEMLLGHPLAPGLRFRLPPADSPQYKEVRPWVELLQTGTFSAESLAATPLSFQTTDRWLAVLQSSFDRLTSAGQTPTWLHYFHIAVALTERGAVQQPIDLFKQALALNPHPVIARCLAVLSATPQEAWPLYEQAWALLKPLEQAEPDVYVRLGSNLVTEMSFFLVQEAWPDQMQAFVDAVPAAFRGLDAFLTLSYKVSMLRGDYSQVVGLLGKECFPTFAKARDDLMATWNAAQEGLAQQAKDKLQLAKGLPTAPLSAVEKHQARVAHPIPDNIGCQYASLYCGNYW